MSELPPLEWLRVKTPTDLQRIRNHVKKGARVNTYNAKLDKNGDWIILLGWVDKPDSDWGRFRGHSKAIWFGYEQLAADCEASVVSALGWPEREPQDLIVQRMAS